MGVSNAPLYGGARELRVRSVPAVNGRQASVPSRQTHVAVHAHADPMNMRLSPVMVEQISMAVVGVLTLPLKEMHSATPGTVRVDTRGLMQVGHVVQPI
jgi:hypothetical protein